jgi:acetylornithine/succinyldiaminopimelate/putrescine aminotransferase
MMLIAGPNVLRFVPSLVIRRPIWTRVKRLEQAFEDVVGAR